MQNNLGQYPNTRLRRTRKFAWSRNLVRQNTLSISDFILAIFVCEGTNIKEPIINMPGVYIYSIDQLIIFLQDLLQKNCINAVMLFPRVCSTKKTVDCVESYNPDNLICRSIKAIKENFNNKIGIIADVALDPYSVHGHDGVIDESGYVLNDQTNQILIKQALNQAQAGCDIVSPSDMMDGRIGEIRQALDEGGFYDVQIMSYSAKFSSSFYGPFRDCIGSTQKIPIDKSSYQMDLANSDESLLEVGQDIFEGADSVIIKPCLLYLDIIAKVKSNFNIPIAAYLVSGEYAMLYSAINNQIFSNEYKILYETYMSIKRAGADIIITYKIPFELL